MKLKYLPDEPFLSGVDLVFNFKMYYGFTDGISTLYDYSGGGFLGTAINSPVPGYPGIEFTAASSMNIGIGTGPTSVKTISLWIKVDGVAGTDYPIRLSGTDFLTIVTGTLTKNGFSGGTTILYTDSVAAATTITANWHHIAITDTSAKNAASLGIARKAANYFDGFIADVRLYSSVLSAARISDIYQLQRHRYQT